MSALAEIEAAEPRPAARAAGGVLRFVTAGSVDDGKSTLIGRLLVDTRQVLEDQLAGAARASRRRGLAETDLSLLTDGLEAEREQGITIDVAYRYFATARRKFIIADTPGHEQYTRNMATGASTAHAAVLLADASRGLAAQTRRHLCIAHLLGIREVLVAVNKMDLAGYAQAAFEQVRRDLLRFCGRLEPAAPRLRFVPVCALRGDMVVERGTNMPWYAGPTLLEALEALDAAGDAASAPLRLPVQLVQRTPERGRTYLGRIASGAVALGDTVLALPAAQRTRVRALYRGSSAVGTARAGDSIALAVSDDIDIAAGDLIAESARPPQRARAVSATLVWLGSDPLVPGARYLLKHTTRTLAAKVALVSQMLDVSTLEGLAPAGPVGMNSVVHAALTAAEPLAFDPYGTNRACGAFILIDARSNQTVAAGMIGAAL